MGRITLWTLTLLFVGRMGLLTKQVWQLWCVTFLTCNVPKETSAISPARPTARPSLAWRHCGKPSITREMIVLTWPGLVNPKDKMRVSFWLYNFHKGSKRPNQHVPWRGSSSCWHACVLLLALPSSLWTVFGRLLGRAMAAIQHHISTTQKAAHHDLINMCILPTGPT